MPERWWMDVWMWRPSRNESGLNVGADLLHYSAGSVFPGTFLLKKSKKKKPKSDLFSQERNLKLLTCPLVVPL